MKLRIKDLRIDNDLTQTEIAEAIGITQRKYSYIETEIQPLNADIICKLSEYFNVSTDYLLGLTDNPKRND